MATLDAVAVRRHLTQKTTQELCDDYEHLANSVRRMPWAEQAISDVLFERDNDKWFEWRMQGEAFGPAMPHPYYGLK
ncbi:hypothetical protein ACFWOT_09050 [Streptomyces sp. NPDC058440]|uniref:hypothetical protein n=1 Tax=Streptomyces sp. NPDC058440 TaxID=3346501 RepID=UPI0036491F82